MQGAAGVLRRKPGGDAVEGFLNRGEEAQLDRIGHIRRPVRDPVALPRNVMATALVQLERQGVHLGSEAELSHARPPPAESMHYGCGRASFDLLRRRVLLAA
jgi:hypothetical protein